MKCAWPGSREVASTRPPSDIKQAGAELLRSLREIQDKPRSTEREVWIVCGVKEPLETLQVATQ